MATRKILLTGLAPKLLAAMAVVVAALFLVLTQQAADKLAESMTSSFESKGEAIALSLSSAAEQNGGTDITAVQGAMDANKTIEGVRYIFIEDGNGAINLHTFSPTFPEGLQKLNTVAIGELTEKQRVKTLALEHKLAEGKLLRAIDVAAPVAGGALGVVHVGMDRDLIDQHVDELRRLMVKRGALVGLAGLLFGMLIIFFSVLRPLQYLTRVTSEIVATGDLTQKIEIHSRDELGVLAETFRQMVEKLRRIPISLDEAMQSLKNSVDNLSGAARDQSDMISRQASALQETQVTAQEIKQTSALAAQKAEAVLQVTSRADELGKAGEVAIEQSLGGLTGMKSEVEQIAAKVRELGERTRQIGGITQSVKDLADQSNMLALNAAIEAVRSGEHGKGFGVVAREIRSLADQSIQATNRVREILDDTSNAIAIAVSISQQGAQKMETGVTQVRSSGENLKQLSGIVKENSAAVRQIAAAVSQQNVGIAQIFTAVTDLSKMMEATVSRLESTNKSVEVLKNVSDQVSSIVKTFRV